MTKTYKINGKEIKSRVEYSNGTSAEKSTSLLLEELLEAISDKEEKCQHKDPYRSGAGTCRECGLHYTESKQEECHICKQPKNGAGSINCSYPHPTRLEPKQSTSLKEEIQSELIGYSLNWKPSSNHADKIISLIQSHLLKEIEGMDYSQQALYSNESRRAYDGCREDIIKIINNIK